MDSISTYVILDIETTGIPRFERNRTKITELTFLAVDRRDIQTANISSMPLINKLSYLFNPQRNIMPAVKDLTGLSNRGLQNQLAFKNRIRSITSFLEELPKPVCLVAHNGNSFDFKLLRTEFIDADENLPNDLLCVDSLWGFRKIMKQMDMNKTLDVNESANSPKTGNKKKSPVKSPANSPESDNDTTSPVNSPADLSKSDNKKTTAVNELVNSSKSDSYITSPVNASVQSSKSNKDDDISTKEEEWPDLNNTEEEWAEIDKLVDEFSKLSAQETPKQMTASSDQPQREKVKATLEKKQKTEKVSCSLEALYKRLLNKEPVNAHRSEGDCIMLLECIVAMKDQFIPYTHEKCKLISAVKPFERR